MTYEQKLIVMALPRLVQATREAILIRHHLRIRLLIVSFAAWLTVLIVRILKRHNPPIKTSYTVTKDQKQHCLRTWNAVQDQRGTEFDPVLLETLLIFELLPTFHGQPLLR